MLLPTTLLLVLPLPALADAEAYFRPSAEARATAAEAATEILADLSELIDDHRAFLEDEQLRIASTWLGKAHTVAKSMAGDEEEVDPETVQELHNNLDEFLRALTGDGDSHRGSAPSGTEAKKVLKGAAAVKKKANKVPSLMEISLVELETSTPAPDAVRYGLLTIDKIEFILAHRGVKQITGGGRRDTNGIMGPSYAALRDALSAMVGDDGSRVAQEDDAGEPLADQLAPIQKALATAREDLRRLRLSLPWADRRIELVSEDLDRLEKNLAKVTALREVPRKG